MQDYPTRYTDLKVTAAKLATHTPELLNDFNQLQDNVMEDKEGKESNVLSSKVKELIALGMAITTQCDGCIAYHVRGALFAGATEEEIIETLGVAVLMGGGPALIYSEEAFVAMRQFEHFENKAVKQKL